MKRLASLMTIVANIAIASPGDDSCVGNCAPKPSNGIRRISDGDAMKPAAYWIGWAEARAKG